MSKSKSDSKFQLRAITPSQRLAVASALFAQLFASNVLAGPGDCKYGTHWSFTSNTCVSDNNAIDASLQNNLGQIPAVRDGSANVSANSNQGQSPWPSDSNSGSSNGNVTVINHMDGSTSVSGDSAAVKNYYGATDEKSGKKNAKDQGNSDGKCATSEKIDGNYQCDSTYRFLDNSKLATTLSQAAGGAAVTASGTIGGIKAQNAGTQSAVMDAAASSQEKAGMLQTTVGLATAAMGAYEIKLSRDHKNIQDQLDAKQKQQNSYNAETNPAPDGTELFSAKDFKAAKGEQKKTEQDAMQQGVLSIIQGAQQAIAGGLAISAAKQAKDLAGKLSDATGSSYQLTSANPTDLTHTTGSTTAINPGTATDPAVATTDGNIKAKDVPTITPPINPDGTPGGPGAGPAAGGFTSGSPQSAGGGGGNPNIGVGSMQAAKGDPEPTGPKMADSKSNTTYSQGSAGYAPGSGVSAEKSADLGFLANLLPKPQEEMGKNGILDYGAGRSPASAAPYSFLGKDVNIFQRISDRTTAKFKSGDVGGT